MGAEAGGKAWEKIGSAQNVVSLASHQGWLYCLDKQQSIWQMELYGAAPCWLPCEGYKQGRLSAITAFDGMLYGCTKVPHPTPPLPPTPADVFTPQPYRFRRCFQDHKLVKRAIAVRFAKTRHISIQPRCSSRTAGGKGLRGA